MVRRISKRSSRRKPNMNRDGSWFGSTKTQRFNTITSHQTLSAAIAGLNNTTFTYVTLVGNDLPSNRLVRLRNFTIRVHPTNQSTTAAAHYSMQVAWVDPTSGGFLVPVTQDKPLSSTNTTVFRGRVPQTTAWLSATSGNVALTITLWAQSVLVSGLIADIFCNFDVAQDFIS